MANIVNREYYAGEDVTLTLYARDRSNLPLSLSSTVVTWRVGRGPAHRDNRVPLFTKTATVSDAAAGIFTVALTSADTYCMQGDYLHQAWALFGSAESVVAQGRLRILPYLMGS